MTKTRLAIIASLNQALGVARFSHIKPGTRLKTGPATAVVLQAEELEALLIATLEELQDTSDPRAALAADPPSGDSPDGK